MAVDTRDKRFSMMGFSLPIPKVLANPDGTIDSADRYQMLYLYSGISLAGAPTETLLDYERGYMRGFMRGIGL
jgi:hypothetical protein